MAVYSSLFSLLSWQKCQSFIKYCHFVSVQLEGLEFLHESEYVHADIKGSNLLIGLSHPERVYLVDYGLAYRYSPDGKHKQYEKDPRKAHDGTIEFTSIDAHDGVCKSISASWDHRASKLYHNLTRTKINLQWPYLQFTVELLIKDPPRKAQPPNKGHPFL